MSAIAGVFSRDGATVDRRGVCGVLARLADRGPDHQAAIAMGPAGLGHALFQTVPEDRPGAQPAVDEARGLALVLDGRVDNRDEIAALAGGAAPGDRSDAALLLSAYAVAGTRMFERILGDFAIAVWDGPRGAFIAARDVFGIRPLVYRALGPRLLVASELRALVPEGAVTPDEGRVAEMLAGAPTSLEDSLYREIKRLAPGHLLIATAAGVRVERFTAIDGTRRLEPRASSAFGDEFRALMDAAVRARLRVSCGAGMMLSGGLDSTSVYCTVRAIAPDADVPAFTIVHRAGSDESPVARATVNQQRGRFIPVPEGFDSFDQAEATRRLLEAPISPGGTNSSALRRRAAGDGRRVLLSGLGGDEWFTGSHWAGADLLRRGRLGALIRLWRARRSAIDRPGLLPLAQSTIVPLVPAPLRRLARRVFDRRAAPPWLRREFISRVALPDRLRVRPEVTASSVARRAILIEALHGLSVYAFEDDDRVSALCGTEDRMPFYDRRVVDFALAVPDEVLAAQPIRKQFVRDAMAARLPPPFHTERPCLDYEFIHREGLERLGGLALFDRLALADAGLVDGRLAREAAAACWEGRSFAGIAPGDLRWPLWSLAAVEVWWRTVIGGPQRVASR